MRFLIAGEGLTDFIVLQNLLRGFFNDKNLSATRLLPKDKEPVGWGNLFNYLTAEEFKQAVPFSDYTIVQIDTGTSQEWKKDITSIDSKTTDLIPFIEAIKTVLINKMGFDFYNENKDKILFAICVHDIECWLLPFNATLPAHQKKMVGCVNAIEKLANEKGFSINEKNYAGGKHYDILSKPMRGNGELITKGKLNESLSFSFMNYQKSLKKIDNPHFSIPIRETLQANNLSVQA